MITLVYMPTICDTCSGETDGTGTVVDNDLDNDGVCDDDEVLGCTDAEACNYNILATDEDDSCIYPSETYLDCNGDCLSDLDLDGICDEIDDDIDGDGIDNNWENENGLNPYDPQDSLSDLDQDGLSNIEEYIYSTNPNNIDTDGDGLNDFDEINMVLTLCYRILIVIMMVFLIILMKTHVLFLFQTDFLLMGMVLMIILK